MTDEEMSMTCTFLREEQQKQKIPSTAGPLLLSFPHLFLGWIYDSVSFKCQLVMAGAFGKSQGLWFLQALKAFPLT